MGESKTKPGAEPVVYMNEAHAVSVGESFVKAVKSLADSFGVTALAIGHCLPFRDDGGGVMVTVRSEEYGRAVEVHALATQLGHLASDRVVAHIAALEAGVAGPAEVPTTADAGAVPAAEGKPRAKGRKAG